MKNYFIDNHSIVFSGGPTHRRRWTPLDLLNSLSLLRRDGLWAKLISIEEALALKGSDKSRFFISTSTIDMWQCPPLNIPKSFFDLCKKLASKGELYVSGYHPTLLPDLVLEQTGAKAVIRGEPEETIMQICKSESLDQVRGITFRRDGKTVNNQEQTPYDLSNLPVPAYDQIDLNDYKYPLMDWERFVLFETSRGCRYECDFCGKDIMYGRGFRQKTIDQVKNEIMIAITQYGAKTGYFYDLDFLSDKSMVKQICNYIIEEQFDFMWSCQTRVNEADNDILRLMAKAGCRLIYYGIESYRHLIDGVKYKSYTAEKLRDIIRLTESLEIKTLCFYIIVFNNNRILPDDKKTIQLMRYVNSSFISLHRYYNYKSKEIIKQKMLESGKRKMDSVDRIIFINTLLYYLHPARLTRFVFKEFHNKPIRRGLHYLRILLGIQNGR